MENVGSGTSITGQTGSAMCDFLGGANTLFGNNNNTWISVAQTYGSLPATFPAGATVGTTGAATPGIWLRFAA